MILATDLPGRREVTSIRLTGHWTDHGRFLPRVHAQSSQWRSSDSSAVSVPASDTASTSVARESGEGTPADG